jgi:hypothetical protein
LALLRDWVLSHLDLHPAQLHIQISSVLGLVHPRRSRFHLRRQLLLSLGATMTENKESIDLENRYRILDREELVMRISLSLAEDFELFYPEQILEEIALLLRVGFHSLHDRTNGELLLIAKYQGIIDNMLENGELREIDTPPLLEWMESRTKGEAR